MVQFNRGGQDAFDANAVATHHKRHFLALRVEHARAHRVAVLRGEFEDVPDFERLGHAQCAGAIRTAFAFGNRAQISPSRHLNVAFNVYIAQVMIVLVCAGRHISASA